MGVAGLRLVADDAHHVDLAMFIDGIAHGLAVYGKTLVLLSIGIVPALKRVIEMEGIDTDEDVANDGLARDEVGAVFEAAAEASSGLGSQAFSPVGDSLVTPHPAEDRTRCNGEYGGETMSTALPTAEVGNVEKE